MKRVLLTLSGAVFSTLFFLLAQPGAPQDRTQQPILVTDEEKQVRAILTATDPSHAAAGYGSLFKSATTDGLRRLQMNPSDTIAIQAAWEEVELTVPEEPDRVVRPDRDKLSRFIGFFEGRARVQPPQWWTEALLDARANRRGNVYAGGLNVAVYEVKEPKTLALPRQASFDRLDGKPVIRVGPESAPVPEGLREKLDKGLADGVCALITASHCFVAAYDDVGYPYRLACVERSSGKIRWVADVWASWWGGASGLHQQWVEVTEQSDRVAVFGVASSGFHAEVFQVDDGVNVLRFSNSYSGW